MDRVVVDSSNTSVSFSMGTPHPSIEKNAKTKEREKKITPKSTPKKAVKNTPQKTPRGTSNRQRKEEKEGIQTPTKKRKKDKEESSEEPPKKKQRINETEREAVVERGGKKEKEAVTPLEPWVGLHCCQWSRNVGTHNWIAYGGYSGFLVVRKLTIGTTNNGKQKVGVDLQRKGSK